MRLIPNYSVRDVSRIWSHMQRPVAACCEPYNEIPLNSRNSVTRWATISFTVNTVFRGISYISTQNWLKFITENGMLLTHTRLLAEGRLLMFLPRLYLMLLSQRVMSDAHFHAFLYLGKFIAKSYLECFSPPKRRSQIISEDGCFQHDPATVKTDSYFVATCLGTIAGN
jgi:hypothetical protein